MRDRDNPSVVQGLAQRPRPITAADLPMIAELTAWEAAPNQPIETSTLTAERYRAPAEPDPEAHEAVQRILANRRNSRYLTTGRCSQHVVYRGDCIRRFIVHDGRLRSPLCPYPIAEGP